MISGEGRANPAYWRADTDIITQANLLSTGAVSWTPKYDPDNIRGMQLTACCNYGDSVRMNNLNTSKSYLWYCNLAYFMRYKSGNILGMLDSVGQHMLAVYTKSYGWTFDFHRTDNTSATLFTDHIEWSFQLGTSIAHFWDVPTTDSDAILGYEVNYMLYDITQT